ncbi:carbon starvation CstA family protein [Cryobacterium sp. N22]|uniref:carbon starvation CstA family protein n=1 Tax=Cryobacterium sp. N22 TaxID=2048290 RepID=UPI000CE2E0F7|nr:carbon starvation CstA family protein [Cryobacterium sp. N22]
MASEEQRACIMAVVTIVAYGIYLVLVLGAAAGAPLEEAAYIPAMLWTIVGSIVAGIVLNILAAILSPREAGRKDQRDKEIHRLGEHIGQSFVILGAVLALVFAITGLDAFWIANVIYLAFVLSSILASVAKIIAYRRGFQSW